MWLRLGLCNFGVRGLRIFYLNLERAQHRRKSMELQSLRLGLSMQRIIAPDAEKLSLRECDRPPAPTKRGINRLFGFMSPQYRPMTPGEVACFLGHRSIWKKIAVCEDEYCAIFEDDVWLSPESREFFMDNRWIPKGTDIVKVDTNLRRICNVIPAATKANLPHPNFILRRLSSYHCCSGGYLLSRRAAQKLIDASCVPIAPVDDHLFNPRNYWVRRMRIFQLDPAICAQPEGLTLVGAKHDLLDGPPNSFIGNRSKVAAWKPNAEAKIHREIRRIPMKAWQLSRTSRIFGQRKQCSGWLVNLATTDNYMWPNNS